MPSAPATATRQPGGKWPRRRRLLRRAEFRATYEQGMRRSSRHFTVFARARPADAAGGALDGAVDGARFGITASRKVGNSVVRNRLRRRTRALLRGLGDGPAGNYDIVINPRPAAAEADFAALGRELDEQLRGLCARLQPVQGEAAP